MTSDKLSRRDMVRITGIGGAALFLSSCFPERAALFSTDAAEIPTREIPDIEIALTAIPDEVQILPGNKTTVWRYKGEVITGPAESLHIVPNSYLGPTFNVIKGQTIRVHFINGLPEKSIVHWHGLHVPVEADGHPRLAIEPGETYVYDFTVTDRAGTYWYHPHPHGRTGVQAYAGMAGLFIVHDKEEQRLGLPSGEYDLPIVIQDRSFDSDNQLIYGNRGMMDRMVGFLGNQILINGIADFNLSVSTHPYRLRLLNGSNSRIYKLAWDDNTPLTVIATDGGLLERPVQRDYITLAPAQRVELWVDFSQDEVGRGKNLINLPFDAIGGEFSYPLLRVNVEQLVKTSTSLPDHLSTIAWQKKAEAVNRRSPRGFQLALGQGMAWTLNGRTFEMEAVASDEIVRLGDLEIWEFENRGGSGMGMMGGMTLPHPIHVHSLQYQIIEREISPSNRGAWASLRDGFVDEGWHDTVLVMPGERVKILLKFEDYTGLYLYHCHNLEHEDMGMMRNFRVDA